MADTFDISRILEDAAGEDEDGGSEDHFGVHVSQRDLYACIFFLSCVYFSGFISARFFSMPTLVGEILAGIVFGPNCLDLVPNAEAFVMLGELGLVLLVLEAGIDIDLITLKLVGKRGVIIALVGTILPVAFAVGLARLLGFGGIEAIAAGCTFAPTSLGIAMNVLRQANLVNTPVGQAVVAAAIIDDMLALIILSQLQAFAGDAAPTVLDLLIPVISAVAFLIIGGSIAVLVLPRILDKLILGRIPNGRHHNREWLSLAIMFVLLLSLMPAAYFAKASPLMGAFLAGLVFCSSDGTHHFFRSQFKRVLQWLMRIFAAASIGFQVPVLMFGNHTVLLQGLTFSVALMGKLAVGFLVPNFSLTERFRGLHLRDCLVVGFSMMAEGEFAFVIAIFSLKHGMITQDVYASVTLAILLSMIMSPFFLRAVISYFNKKIEGALNGTSDDLEARLSKGVRERTALFYRLQIQCSPAWGLLSDIIDELNALGLEVIDHRKWHPRGSNALLIKELYVYDARDQLLLGEGDDSEADERAVAKRAEEITEGLRRAIGQTEILVQVRRWEPRMPKSSARSTREHIVHATTAALKKASGEDLGTPHGTNMYVRMEGATPSDSSQRGIDTLDKRYRGRLDGLFRHDIQGDDVELTEEDAELLVSLSDDDMLHESCAACS